MTIHVHEWSLNRIFFFLLNNECVLKKKYNYGGINSKFWKKKNIYILKWSD